MKQKRLKTNWINLKYLTFLLLLSQLQESFETVLGANNISTPLTEVNLNKDDKTARLNGNEARTRNAAGFKMKKSHLHRSTAKNLYPPDDITSPNEDYFASYDADYSAPLEKNLNVTSMMYDNDPENAAIFPNPEMIVYEADKNVHIDHTEPSGPDVLPEVELPSNWLSDSDLRERDRIDSVEYVYYGSNGIGMGGHASYGRGRWNAPFLVATGICSVIMMTTGWVLTKKKGFRTTKMFPVEMNLLTCLFITNTTMLLGIQDTSNRLRCEVVALLLHYLHLVCACWISIYCFLIMDNVTKGRVPNLRYNYLFAYGLPAALVLFFYAISMERYETIDYCWMSLERGMLLGLMFPGTALIIGNTLVAIIGLRAATDKRQKGLVTNIQARIAQAVARQNSNAPSAKYTSNNSLVSVDSRRTEPNVNLNNECNIIKGKNFEDGNIVEGTSWMLSCSVPQIFDMSDHRDASLYASGSLRIDMSTLSMDNLSWKSAEPEGVGELRAGLNLALILQPLFCLGWLMGVVAIENANQPMPPFTFAFLWIGMHLFMFYRFSRVLPYIPYATGGEVWTGEQVTQTPRSLAGPAAVAGQENKSTDTIPLLVTKTESPTPAAPHTISTITQ